MNTRIKIEKKTGINDILKKVKKLLKSGYPQIIILNGEIYVSGGKELHSTKDLKETIYSLTV